MKIFGFLLVLALFLSLAINERFVGGVEIYHIPPDTHHFVAIRENGLKNNAWYHFSTGKVDFALISRELEESPVAISDLVGKYDLRSALKDKESGEMVYVGYAYGNSGLCHAFIKNAEKAVCDTQKVEALYAEIDQALRPHYWTRFVGWLLQL